MLGVTESSTSAGPGRPGWRVMPPPTPRPSTAGCAWAIIVSPAGRRHHRGRRARAGGPPATWPWRCSFTGDRGRLFIGIASTSAQLNLLPVRLHLHGALVRHHHHLPCSAVIPGSGRPDWRPPCSSVTQRRGVHPPHRTARALLSMLDAGSCPHSPSPWPCVGRRVPLVSAPMVVPVAYRACWPPPPSALPPQAWAPVHGAWRRHMRA